jgi:hypothetical protein
MVRKIFYLNQVVGSGRDRTHYYHDVLSKRNETNFFWLIKNFRKLIFEMICFVRKTNFKNNVKLKITKKNRKCFC